MYFAFDCFSHAGKYRRYPKSARCLFSGAALASVEPSSKGAFEKNLSGVSFILDVRLFHIVL